MVGECVGEEICVEEDAVGRGEGGIVREEEGGGVLGDGADGFGILFGGDLSEGLFFLVLFEAGVALGD